MSLCSTNLCFDCSRLYFSLITEINITFFYINITLNLYVIISKVTPAGDIMIFFQSFCRLDGIFKLVCRFGKDDYVMQIALNRKIAFYLLQKKINVKRFVEWLSSSNGYFYMWKGWLNRVCIYVYANQKSMSRIKPWFQSNHFQITYFPPQ